jgi:ketosteroid isomerase-like protein
MPETYIAALNTHDPNQIIPLYTSDAVYISSSSTLQGSDAIRQGYINLLQNSLAGATFTLISSSATGDTRHFSWRVITSQGLVRDGNDTIGLVNNQISYHYSHLSAPLKPV